ncbi:hypothetical protein QQ045_001475 [Rhodiola kirilowii]
MILTNGLKRVQFARACVEVDVSVPIPDKVKLTLSDGRIFWQRIEVEGNQSYCSYCKLHGHIILADYKKRKGPRAHEEKTVIGSTSSKPKGDGQRSKKGVFRVTNPDSQVVGIVRI